MADPPARSGDGDGKENKPAESPPFDPQQAEQFLQLLGKDAAQTRIRGFFEKHDPRKQGDPGRKGTYSRELVEQWISERRGIYVVINDGGDKAEQITGCRALFNEWDDQPREWQLTAWQGLGMPAPTCQVDTGRQSIHTYWRLQQLISAMHFTNLQERLVARGESDNLIDPPRVMRLPGCPRGDGEREMVRLIYSPQADGSPLQYDVDELDVRLPQLPPAQAAAEPAPQPRPQAKASPRTGQPCDLPPREIDQIKAALNCIPRRKPGNNNYGAPLGDRDTLWGLVAAVEEAGGTIEQAIELMEAHSPSASCGWDVDQVARSGNGAKTAATFWAIASENGFDLKRNDLKRPAPEPREGTPAQQAPWGKGNTAAEQPAGKQQSARREPPSFDERWALLELHAAELACTTWPVMKTIASLSCKATELEIPRLGQRQLEQLLEQAQRRIREKSEPVLGGQTFTIKPTHWAVEGIFRHGLNLLTGQSGAGKSRLAAACMAAWLRGDQTWLQRPLHGGDPRHRYALIIGTDQTLEDWHLTLGPVGLTTKISDTEVQVHERLTLYSLETGIQLDADGLNKIRRWVDAHPGGMVLTDSLAQCLPPGVDEDKSSAAGPVHKLQEVLGDAWAILTHRTRKGAGKEGNLGVGAGRGSGAIDAAVSRVVGLGLIYRMENGVMQPQESDPRRELLSTKRGGKTEHIIISSDASGFWDVHGSAEALKAQERQERVMANLTEAQSNVLSAFDTADGWLSTRAVVEAMGDTYEASSSKAAGVRKVLKRLVVLGVIEERKVANENTYRTTPNHPNQREVNKDGSVGSVVAAEGISLVRTKVRTGSEGGSEPPSGSEPPQLVRTDSELPSEPKSEPPKTTAPQEPIQPKHQPSRPVRGSGSDTSSAALELMDLLPTAAAQIGSGADVLADGEDDPAWGERPQAAA